MITRTITLGDTEMVTFCQTLHDNAHSLAAMANAKLTTEAERAELLRAAAILQSVQAQCEEWAAPHGLTGRINWDDSGDDDTEGIFNDEGKRVG